MRSEYHILFNFTILQVVAEQEKIHSCVSRKLFFGDPLASAQRLRMYCHQGHTEKFVFHTPKFYATVFGYKFFNQPLKDFCSLQWDKALLNKHI